MSAASLKNRTSTRRAKGLIKLPLEQLRQRRSSEIEISPQHDSFSKKVSRNRSCLKTVSFWNKGNHAKQLLGSRCLCASAHGVVICRRQINPPPHLFLAL